MKKKSASVSLGVRKGVSPLHRGILKGVSPLSLSATRFALGLPVAAKKKPPLSVFSFPTSALFHQKRVERSRQPLPLNSKASILKHMKICQDRQKRKEVLFAKRNVGRGIAIHTSKKITENSKVRC